MNEIYLLVAGTETREKTLLSLVLQDGQADNNWCKGGFVQAWHERLYSLLTCRTSGANFRKEFSIP